MVEPRAQPTASTVHSFRLSPDALMYYALMLLCCYAVMLSCSDALSVMLLVYALMLPCSLSVLPLLQDLML